MAKQNLGRVSIVFKGEYNVNTQYEQLDVVSYNGSSYIALKLTKGNAPTNTEYWGVMAEKGEATDLSLYSLISETGNKIELTIDNNTYVMSLKLKDKNNNTISMGSIDLPLETMVVGASYDDEHKKIILTLKNSQTIDVPVGSLISGLQSEITESNKLNSDLVDDTNSTNKFVTNEEKDYWNNKSNFSGNYDDLNNKPTIPTVPTNVGSFSNDAGYLTLSTLPKYEGGVE